MRLAFDGQVHTGSYGFMLVSSFYEVGSYAYS